MIPIFSRSWLMKTAIVFDLDNDPVSLRRACDMSRAWRPTWVSPISPSISARGVNAATESIKDGVEVVGSRTRVKVVKNKVAPPFRQAEFDIMYGKGISREGSLIDVGVEQGIVRKSGAWYTYDGDQLGQGKENSRTFLKENPDVASAIEKRILEKLGVGQSSDATGGASLPPVDF